MLERLTHEPLARETGQPLLALSSLNNLLWFWFRYSLQVFRQNLVPKYSSSFSSCVCRLSFYPVRDKASRSCRHRKTKIKNKTWRKRLNISNCLPMNINMEVSETIPSISEKQTNFNEKIRLRLIQRNKSGRYYSLLDNKKTLESKD